MTVTTSTVAGAGGIGLAVYERNIGADETVVLIHGYPDNHRVWEPVADRLADRFHVVTYDVRGAGASEVPDEVEAYGLPLLAADFRAVVSATVPEGRQVHLVGHDWGSLQGWDFVCDERCVDLIASYTSISGPNLDAVGEFMHRGGAEPPQLSTVLRQALKSWYVMAFQIPRLAPAYWRSSMVAKTWPEYLAKVERVPQGAIPVGEELRQCQADGANGVNLYRANMMTKMRRPRRVHTDIAVQVVVPLRDRYVSPALAESVVGLCDDLVFRQVDAGHWVVLSDPDSIAEWIAEHIDRVDGGRSSAE